MRLGYTKSKNHTSYYVYKTGYKNGRNTTVTVEKLGNETAIREKYGVEDAEAWARKHVEKLNRKAAEKNSVINIPFSPSVSIPTEGRRSFNVGYTFLQQIYYDLGLHTICTMIKRRHKFSYNLNSILSRLVYARIIYPSSKLATYELSQKFIEQPDFDSHQIYRALSVLADEADYIQSSIYKNSLKLLQRKTGVIYYDCTNYYFETEEASGIRQYGHSKENRPNPIVQMGLFMDRDGIPLAFTIDPGNTNEQITLKPLEQKLLSDFSMSRFVVCTDAGLASTGNRLYNNEEGRAFITVQSLKTLKGFQKEWALEKDGWKKAGGQKGYLYNLEEIDEEKEYDSLFYKERWFNENHLEQRMIVTYQLKYRDYLRNIRNRQIERAKAKVNKPSTIKRKSQQDPSRLISRNSMTVDGEAAERDVYYLDEDIIRQEEKYDGFYAVCTNLDNDADTLEILSVNKRRWKIEESFRIVKHELRARPAYLSRDERIRAHFMTCFLALIVYRFLEKKLDNKYTASEIIGCLRDMNMTKLEGYGYIPSYDRTELTDALHKAFEWDTSKEIVTSAEMRNICKRSKNR